MLYFKNSLNWKKYYHIMSKLLSLWAYVELKLLLALYFAKNGLIQDDGHGHYALWVNSGRGGGGSQYISFQIQLFIDIPWFRWYSGIYDFKINIQASRGAGVQNMPVNGLVVSSIAEWGSNPQPVVINSKRNEIFI